MTARSTHLRAEGSAAHRVTFVELFFDLVYVFAITQLSHGLADDLTWRGAANSVLLLLAVWWAWVYTAWGTNWINPDNRVVRLMLLGVAGASLLMAVALPGAFGDGPYGLLFATAYSALQLGRSGFVLWAFRNKPARFRNMQRILSWHVAASVLWIGGGLVSPDLRPLLWIIALAIDYAGPVIQYLVPGLGRSQTTEWTVHGGHFAERFQLFIILALGESIVVTGATASDAGFDAITILALVLAFGGAATLWWIYFDSAAEEGANALERAGDTGRLARSAYTYFHLPIVAGIIVSAVADELVIAHPVTDAEPATAAVTLIGPAFFLAGHALFKRATWGTWSVSRLAGAGLLLSLIPIAGSWPPVVIGAVAIAIVIGVAVAEAVARRSDSGGTMRP